MTVADVGPRSRLTATSKIRDRCGAIALFGVLAAYTLTTMDGEETASRAISAITLLLAAIYLAFPVGQRLTLRLPAICLLFMALYGVLQTSLSPQKISYSGWSTVLFWSSAAAITVASTQIFREAAIAARFRKWFVIFGTGIAILDLLEQASQTNKYFWLVESRHATISGPFAYWNNFAQFIELVLPITLWLAIKERKVVLPCLILSGVEIGAVVASGSRAGSALVLAEFMAVMALAYLRHRNRKFLFAAASALVVGIVFAYAAGLDSLSFKLRQRDQLAVRRDINASSVAMIRARPLTGWGLGTYVPVYRMFARYDDGTYVNRAHNDWLEWAAEGGVFFSAAMLAVAIWSIRPAIRSVWGIGALAICLHALVDYPFARLGVCGWYFALVGMLSVTRNESFRQQQLRSEERLVQKPTSAFTS
ncbi:MAG: O-antigen ligase family protein [Acidobacteriaceae bacterium]|nr:O-antigen ligase family protein [Acidobacteriaceae bacterium]